jgi:hypothetical protein
MIDEGALSIILEVKMTILKNIFDEEGDYLQ